MHYYFSISALLTATVHNANQCTYLHFSAPLSIYVSGCLYTCRLCNFFCLCSVQKFLIITHFRSLPITFSAKILFRMIRFFEQNCPKERKSVRMITF